MTEQSSPRVSSRLSNSAKLSNSISRRVHREIRFGEYLLGSTLGQGEFGKVKLGWKRDSPEQVAIKLIRKETVPPKSSREIKVFREINALKLLTHPNIVRLSEVIQNEKYIGIVLEYASGGELFDYILKNKYLKDNAACRLFAQLVSGVYYLHSKGIVHRDLKLENLLLDKHKNVIITDFGFANSFKATPDGKIHDLMSTSCGSPCYAAPELVVSDSKYVGRKVDVWSCGVILYAMLAGYLPFDDDPNNPDGDNITQLYKYITSTPLTFPEYIQPMPRDLLRKILVPDPNRRIDLNSVRSHAWLAPHAHFLSVTPVEWDRSFLKQPTQQSAAPPAQVLQPITEHHKPKRPVSYHPGMSSSGSVFDTDPSVTSLPIAQPASGSGLPIAANATRKSKSHARHNSIQVDTTHVPSYMTHSRRHSVQTGYSKGVTSSSYQSSRPLSIASDDTEIFEYSKDPRVVGNSEETITEQEHLNNTGELHLSTGARVFPQAARKPRPTSSYEPSFRFGYSYNEPRVGITPDLALPGEMSRPPAFKSETPVIFASSSPANSSSSIAIASEKPTNDSDTANASTLVASIIPETTNDVLGVLKEPKRAQHRRNMTYSGISTAAAATAYASSFETVGIKENIEPGIYNVSQSRSSGKGHKHTQSMVSPSAVSTVSPTGSAKSKRFSFLGYSFGSSHGSSANPSPNSTINSKYVFPPPGPIDSMGNANNGSSHSVISAATASTRRKTVDSPHDLGGKKGGYFENSSAARRVVDFFKRKNNSSAGRVQ